MGVFQIQFGECPENSVRMRRTPKIWIQRDHRAILHPQTKTDGVVAFCADFPADMKWQEAALVLVNGEGTFLCVGTALRAPSCICLPADLHAFNTSHEQRCSMRWSNGLK